MISYIKGELIEVLEESVVVETGGIGFEIRVPASVLEEMPEEGSEVKIYTYFHVREDAMQLFGFLEPEDMHVFEMLLGVSGIGPKGALAILSFISGEDLQFAVLADDAKTIAKAPGIGLKTAQKLILELKDKMKLGDAFALKSRRAAKEKADYSQGEKHANESKEKSTEKSLAKKGRKEKDSVKDTSDSPKERDIQEKQKVSEAKNDAILALNALGYSPAEALKAVRQIEEIKDMTTEQIIKAALKNLI